MMVRISSRPSYAQFRVAEHRRLGHELVDGVGCERGGEHLRVAELEAEIRARKHLLDRLAIREPLLGFGGRLGRRHARRGFGGSLMAP